MPKFSPNFIQDLLARTSIVELVRTYVQLQKKGSTWKGLCPFHQEKTPSFVVNEGRKSFHCFGCGQGGDAIQFLREIEGLGFVDAIKELAESAGLPLPREDITPQEAARISHRDRLYKANDVAAKYFASVLRSPEGEEGRRYLESRSYDLEFADQHRLGVAPDGWDGLSLALRAGGIEPRIGEEAGLLVAKKGGNGHYDRFRNRLMFPIREQSGKVVAFGGRTLGDDTAKYINSPESPVYNKSHILYGLYEARRDIHRADKVLVVEGYFDVLGLARAGVGFSVAPCGTALTEQQLSALSSHTKEVVLLFDSDKAGRQAAMRALPICLQKGLWPSYLSVPDGKDPDDFAREHGAEAVQALLETAQPLLDVFIEDSLPGPDDGAQAADRCLEELAPILVMLKPVQQADTIRRVARALGVDARVVEDQVSKAKRSRRPAPQPRDMHPPSASAEPLAEPFHGQEPAAPASAASAAPLTPPQRQLIRLMVQDPPELASLVEHYQAHQWLNHPEVELVVSRLLRVAREERTPHSTELMTGLTNRSLLRDLSEVLTSEESWYPADRLELATRECMLRLRLEWLLRRQTRLTRDLSAQERSGEADSGLLLELARQLNDINRDVERARVHLGTL